MLNRIISILKGTAPLGMEITDTSVKWVDAVKKGNSLQIKAMSFEDLPDGSMEDGKIKDAEAMSIWLKQHVQMNGIQNRDVHLVIPNQSILVRLLKFPDVPMKDLRKIVEFEIKHHIHLPFDEPYYDFIKLDNKPASMNHEPTTAPDDAADLMSWNEAASAADDKSNHTFGLFDEEKTDEPNETSTAQCDVVLVAAPKALIEEYVDLVESSGLKPASIEIKALSLYRLIASEQLIDGSQTFIVVDLNPTMTDLSIFQGNQLKITRNVPLNFTSKKDETTETPVEETVDDNPFSSFTFQSNTAENDFTSSCSDLSHEIERLMNFYRYTLNHRDQEFKYLLISGDIARQAEVELFLQNRLNLSLIPIKPHQVHMDRNDKSFQLTAMAVPLGLALRGKAK